MHLLEQLPGDSYTCGRVDTRFICIGSTHDGRWLARGVGPQCP